MTEGKLDHASVWTEQGHLAEPALHALADGELSLLPNDAVEHAAHCPPCGDRVGEIALFALEIAGALRPQLVAAPLAAARVPLRLVAFSLLIACVTGLPELRAHASGWLRLLSPETWSAALQALVRVLAHAGQTGALNVLIWTSALGLLIASAALVRWSPHARRVSDGAQS